MEVLNRINAFLGIMFIALLLEAIILAIRGVKEGVTTTNSKFEQLINAKS